MNRDAFEQVVADALATLPTRFRKAMKNIAIIVEDEPSTVIVEPHFEPRALEGLAAMGHKIRFDWYTARLAGVLKTETGELEGGTDPRGDRGLAVV